MYFIIVYAFIAFCLMKMAQKANTKNAWFAWIPILNIILLVEIAGKSVWWVISLFIPLVNIVILVLIFMAIVKKLGKPSWLGILMIIPIVNLIVLGYLAFSNSKNISIQSQLPVDPGLVK